MLAWRKLVAEEKIKSAQLPDTLQKKYPNNHLTELLIGWMQCVPQIECLCLHEIHIFKP